ncbi:polysaccharide pyruvyl transferase family protein [Pseudobutyrivibrio sp. LB2011]|uniref:polysaccharide pyruvyl transferase family protein n=1 Tax=Pseudobutyrivibrio sp. LB2011 TaxID=1408312 RepID=UPI0005D21CEE|nr:polysaccharide pyruvyl transferase family protein [Pseudobutyrivibrio sp. LB2011]
MDKSEQIYFKLSKILSNGINVGDILIEMGINKIFLYGYGEIGKKVYLMIRDKVKIVAIVDKGKNSKEEGIIINDISVLKNDCPILVTPSNLFNEITDELLLNGVNRKNILALNTILQYGYEKVLKEEYRIPSINQKQFLITGAQFRNLGAQAMLFTAVDELRKKFGDVTIWYCPIEQDDKKIYSREELNKYKFITLLDGYTRNSTMYEVKNGIDAVVDISGFSLDSRRKSERWELIFELAYKYKIPTYLMPQSYGELDYGIDNEHMKIVFSSIAKIFLRESKDIEKFEKFNLTNLCLANDIVLQKKDIELNNIFESSFNCKRINGPMDGVAIIPNVKNYAYGDKKEIIVLYKKIIEFLLSKKEEVYILCHSNDEQACLDIYEAYINNDHVHLIERFRYCFEFSEYIKNMKYCIASRYHSIVQAYRQNIPCVLIGWAEKYDSLAKIFNQSKYSFSVDELDIASKVYARVVEMESNYLDEKTMISVVNNKRERRNSFDILLE